MRKLDFLYEMWMYAWVPVVPLYVDWLHPGSTAAAVTVVLLGLVLGPLLEVVTGAWSDRVGGHRAFGFATFLGLVSSFFYLVLPIPGENRWLLIVCAVFCATMSEAIVSGSFEAWYEKVPGEAGNVAGETPTLSKDEQRRRDFSGLEGWRQIGGGIASVAGVVFLQLFTTRCPRPLDVAFEHLWLSPLAPACFFGLLALALTFLLQDPSGMSAWWKGLWPGLRRTIQFMRPGWEAIASSGRLPAIAGLYAINWTVIQILAFIVPLVFWESSRGSWWDAIALIGTLLLVRVGRLAGSALATSPVLIRRDDRAIIVFALVVQAVGFVFVALFTSWAWASPHNSAEYWFHYTMAALFVTMVASGTGLAKPCLEVLRQAHAHERIKSTLLSYMALLSTFVAAAIFTCTHLLAQYLGRDNTPALAAGFGFVAFVIVVGVARCAPGLWRSDDRRTGWARTRYGFLLGTATIGAIALGGLDFVLAKDLELVRGLVSFGEDSSVVAAWVVPDDGVRVSRVLSWVGWDVTSAELVPLVTRSAEGLLLVGNIVLFYLAVVGYRELRGVSTAAQTAAERQERSQARAEELREQFGASVTVTLSDCSSSYVHVLDCATAAVPARLASTHNVVWIHDEAHGDEGTLLGFVLVEHNPRSREP